MEGSLPKSKKLFVWGSKNWQIFFESKTETAKYCQNLKTREKLSALGEQIMKPEGLPQSKRVADQRIVWYIGSLDKHFFLMILEVV